MKKLGPHGRHLVKAGDRFDPPPDARARVREKLARRLGAAAVVGSIAAAEATATAGAGAAGGAGVAGGVAAAGQGWAAVSLVKWVGVIVVAGVASGGAWSVADSTGARAPATMRAAPAEAASAPGRTVESASPATTAADAPAAIVVAPAIARSLPEAHLPEARVHGAESPRAAHVAPPARPGEEARPSSAALFAAPEPSPSPAPAAASLGAEAALLREAQIARASGDAARALTLLERHAGAYPKSALDDVARTEQVLALCALGRDAEARALARPLLEARESAASPLAARLRESCAREIP